ncbi:hypothetical protein EYF80_038679 [Liparis tanakae]|uniref:Uncharacterized protein n=1 Tax=Liparis tanakae TaxID=230148 RepID=A0A4Z2GEJ4_9TELE|nr:hypothetical protein EYF80_038679 [Liparis tanakae]
MKISWLPLRVLLWTGICCLYQWITTVPVGRKLQGRMQSSGMMQELQNKMSQVTYYDTFRMRQQPFLQEHEQQDEESR